MKARDQYADRSSRGGASILRGDGGHKQMDVLGAADHTPILQQFFRVSL